MVHFIYALALFTSASLLFIIQPMAARWVQPALGGTPAVWNTSMVFFQATLLAGYLYAHLSVRWLGPRRQALAHLVIVTGALFFLPLAIGTPPDAAATDAPAWWLLKTFLISFGWPVLVISTTSPLLQRWFAELNHRHADDPYHLYAAGNLGSLLAIAAYPLFIEPQFGLSSQAIVWTATYLIFCGLVAGCAAFMWRTPGGTKKPKKAPSAPPAAAIALTWRRRLKWLIWAIIPSSLMLIITTFLTTDLAPAPLLWIPPLAIYLISFIVVFARHNPIPNRWWLYACLPLLAIDGFLLAGNIIDPLIFVGAIKILLLALVCLTFHGALADDRPATGHLTEFYLWIALGGVLGGLFPALVAPLLFETYLEYGLILVLSALALPAIGISLLQPLRPLLAVALIGVAILSAWPDDDVIFRTRSFFGTHKVKVSADGSHHLLYHGRTLHGAQAVDADQAQEPLMYYHRQGPLGQVFEILARRQKRHPIAAIGLGAGTLTAYVEDDQTMDIFEIDEAVIDLASDDSLFTYLDQCGGRCVIHRGDGRILAADADDERYELIVVDAYSSAAVPMHLLTQEALATYADKLRPQGLLAIHISSRYLDLEPPLTQAAHQLGLTSRVRRQFLDDDDPLYHEYAESSEWLLIAKDPQAMGPLAADPQWMALDPDPSIRAWTDNYANIIDVWQN